MQAGLNVDNYVVGMEDGLGYEEEGFSEEEPNMLVVRVRRARALVAMDSNLGGVGTSDPYVKLTCEGVQHR